VVHIDVYLVDIKQSVSSRLTEWECELLALLDDKGNCLDKVSCSGDRRYVLWTEGPLNGERDGARFVIRDPAIEEGYWDFYVDHGAEHYWFCSYSSEKASISFAELSTRGTCRVAIRDGRFEVLWPPPEAGKEVSP
jgi:hypothetical protein